MMREIPRRLMLAPLLALAMLVAALAVPVAVLLGRRSYPAEIGSAASCLLNAMSGGPRSVTYSAWSWERRRRGKRGAGLRVALVDALNFEPGHCQAAWLDHRARGLIQ